MMSASHVHVASNKNKTFPLPVIIVGGGLAGLSLSLGLASLGFQVEVVEKQPNFSRTGATFGLALNGQKALEELCGPGIVRDLKLVGLDLDPPDMAIMLGWWDVRDALLDQVLKKKSMITIRHGWLLQDIKDDDDTTSLKAVFHTHKQDDHCEDREQQELLLEGCMLVGADGVNSSVRSLLGLVRAKNTGVLTWRARVQVPPRTLCDEEQEGTEQRDDAMLSTLRPMVESPLKVAFTRARGPVLYALFNFNEKLPGTMALVVTHQQQQGEGEDERTARKKGTSPRAIMEENAESDDERKEIQAILEFVTDKDGLYNPTLMKVVEPPMEAGAGWGGKGRITIVGDAAHGMFFLLVHLMVCLTGFLFCSGSDSSVANKRYTFFTQSSPRCQP
jgi:2-polyprenyl-6-methoxyphenol hydroxylase-like FAD-dependent oxidoreductase